MAAKESLAFGFEAKQPSKAEDKLAGMEKWPHEFDGKMGFIAEPVLLKYSKADENIKDVDEGQYWSTPTWVEVRKQFDLAGSMVLANLLQYSIAVISTMFVGHLGELELSSASLATSFGSVTGFYVLLGLSSGLETLCGQAYGAKNFYLLSVYLQAAILVLVGLCIPISILWWNIELVLLLLGQDPEISKLAGVYFAWLLPALFASAVIQPLSKFMQSQSLVKPMLYCALITFVVHIPMTYMLINTLGLGFHGGALGVSVSYTLNLLLLLAFIHFSREFEETWTGLKQEAFGAITTYMKLAVPSAAMICLEYWAYEVLLLLAGLLPDPKLQVSLLSICLTTGAFMYMIPFGLGGAASVRVANELGAGHAAAAKFATRVAVGISVVLASIISATYILVRNLWGKAFSDEEAVVQAVAHLMPLMAVSTFLDFVQGILSGVARGCGWQESGAWVNLAAFYAIGLPSALVLGYHFEFGPVGLWLGFYVGLGTQLALLIVLTVTTNWEKMVEDAKERLNTRLDNDPTLPLLG